MKDYLNPDVDTVVDHKNLEWEWFRQSGLYFDYAEAQAEAEEEQGLAKLKIDVVKAEIEEKVRNDPEAFGVDDPKEAAIKAAVAKHEDVQKAHKKHIRSTRVNKVLIGALRALEHKKRTLEKADERKSNGIYSEPRVPKSMRDAKRSVDMDAGKKLRQRINKVSKSKRRKLKKVKKQR